MENICNTNSLYFLPRLISYACSTYLIIHTAASSEGPLCARRPRPLIEPWRVAQENPLAHSLVRTFQRFFSHLPKSEARQEMCVTAYCIASLALRSEAEALRRKLQRKRTKKCNAKKSRIHNKTLKIG